MIKNVITPILFVFIAVFVVSAAVLVVDQTSVAEASFHSGGGGSGGGTGGTGGDGCGGCGGDDPDPTPDPDPQPPVCQYLKANGQTGTLTLPYGGGSVDLTWASLRATGATLTPTGASVPVNGGQTVNITEDETYIFNVTNSDGSDTCRVNIDVQEDRALTCQDVVFEASDTTVTPGTSVNLSWIFTGDVADAWLVPDIADPMAVNNVDVTVDNTSTYNMNIKNAVNQVACPLTVTVEEDPQPITCGNNVTFTADDYSLPKGGGDVTLTWTTTGIDAINIPGVVSNNLSDSEVVNVSSDTTYTMSLYKDNTVVDTCPLAIDVASGGGGGGSSSPKCDLDISGEKIKKGESVTLDWNTSRAKEVRIEDNYGNVLIDSEDSEDFDGKMTIKPTKDTEYTLFSKKGTKQRTCAVEVEVENSVTVLETRSQDPRVAGISLTQVPYTGFEAGPTLTTIFYALLTIWGLFIAYVVVIRRKGAGGVSFAGAHDHVDFTDQSVDASNTQESSVAEGYVYEATAEVPTNLPTAQALPKVVGYDAYTEKKTMNQ